MTTYAPSTTDTLVVSEVFGPTIQGEGPTVGRRAGFIRLGGCNLACSWCDTAYTWDAARHDLRDELHRNRVPAIVNRALHGNPGLVVITGGEPMLHQQQPGWTALLRALTAAGVDIEIETNGTTAPTPDTIAHRVRYNVSPKLAHSGDPLNRRIRPAALAALVDTGRAIFKFVCASPADVDEAVELCVRYGIPPRTVWISPEGTTVAAVLRHTTLITDRTIEHGANLGTRLHVLAWGDERGR